MVILLRWGWLLGIALLGPIALPAGGAQCISPQIRFRKSSDPFLSTRASRLRATPIQHAPIVRKLVIGTPFRVLRKWQGSDGKEWLYVQVFTSGESTTNSARNGWLDV